jgi:hypothetical protein
MGGFRGYRPFIDSPLDRYIYMLDSMIFWMRMMLWFIICCILIEQDRLNEPGVFWGVGA